MDTIAPGGSFNTIAVLAEEEGLHFKLEDLTCEDSNCGGVIPNVFASRSSVGMLMKDLQGNPVPAECPCCKGTMKKSISAPAVIGLERRSAPSGSLGKARDRVTGLIGRAVSVVNQSGREVATGTIVHTFECPDCGENDHMISLVALDPPSHSNTSMGSTTDYDN